MTPSEHDSDAQPAQPAAPSSAASSSASTPSFREDAQAARRRALSRWLGAGLVLALIVIVALAAALRHQQQQLDAFGREATRRLDDIVQRTDTAATQARQALQQAQALETRVGTLDARAAKLEDQQNTLMQSYRELVSGNDEALLVDVEQSLVMAAEQLQVAGRVPTAIAALQLAEARLARAGRPAFAPIQQAIARDTNRLRAMPMVDLSAIGARIDELVAAVETLPMAAVDTAVVPPAATAGEAARDGEAHARPRTEVSPDDPWWQRAWIPVRDWSADVRASAVEELRELVRVRRIDRPEALLLAPEQMVVARTQLTLRLLEARMALLSRETSLWQSDLDAVAQGVRTYADPDAAATARVLRTLAELREIDPAPAMPDLADSLRAVRAQLARGAADDVDGADTTPPAGE